MFPYVQEDTDGRIEYNCLAIHARKGYDSGDRQYSGTAQFQSGPTKSNRVIGF